MKEHILDNDDIEHGQPPLCGRHGEGLSSVGSSFVVYFSRIIKKEDWCKTCKNLYNANIARNQQERLK